MALKQVGIGTLKKGSYVLVDGVPCIVKSIQTSKTGKHGHAKARVEAVGIINPVKKIFVKPAHDNIDVPLIEKKTAQILSINAGVANVMDMESYETFDLKIPEDLKGEVKEGGQVLYWIILDDKVMKQIK